MSDTAVTVLVYVVTALAALVALATALAAGQGVLRGWPLLHTAAAAVGLVVWLTFLVAPADSALGDPGVGIVGLGCWWVVGIVGLVLVNAALRRGTGLRVVEDGTRTTGWIPVIGHLLALAAGIVMTWAYITARV